MALFYTGVTNSYANLGIKNNFAASFAVTVFQGVQPSAADITSSWSSSSANYLQHWTGCSWTQPSLNSPPLGNTLQLTAIPAATTANATGTATWAILWGSNVSEASVQTGTLPNANFIVGPVTDLTGNGIVRLSSNSITIGASSSPTDVVLSFGT